MVLLNGARAATKDVDGVAVAGPDAATIRRAVARVAALQALPEDWLNDGAKGYLHGITRGEALVDRPALLVCAARIEQLLAMKLCAWRDDIDVADAALLLARMPGTRDDLWQLIEPFVVPGRELKARYAFDDHWEARDGSH